MKKLTALFAATAIALTAGLAQARDLGPDEALKLRDAGTIKSFEELEQERHRQASRLERPRYRA